MSYKNGDTIDEHQVMLILDSYRLPRSVVF